MKCFALFAFILASSVASASGSDQFTLKPGTYQSVDYATVYCFGWGANVPPSTGPQVYLQADGTNRCNFTAITYEREKVTRVFPIEFPDSSRPAKMRPDLFQLELERQQQLKEEFERRQNEEGWRIEIPIFGGKF